MVDCVFCRILSGEAEASFVYRDELCAAFLDLQPVNAGHLLVVPREHCADLRHTSPQVAAHLMTVARDMAGVLRKAAPRCDGVNFLLADGEAAGQEVFHLHMHVIPRFASDGFGFKFAASYYQLPSRAELDRTAAALRAALAAG